MRLKIYLAQLVCALTLLAGVSARGIPNTTLGGNITVPGSQTYPGPVSLTNNTTIVSTGGGNITFASTVDGAYNLTISTSGNTALDGKTGGSVALSSLTITGAVINLNGGNVTTTGNQTYNGAVTLGNITALTSSSGGNVNINSTLDGAQPLQINTTGQTTLGGVTGGSVSLSSLSITGAVINLRNYPFDKTTATGWGVGTVLVFTFELSVVGLSLAVRSTQICL